jgi:hypothetical protein
MDFPQHRLRRTEPLWSPAGPREFPSSGAAHRGGGEPKGSCAAKSSKMLDTVVSDSRRILELTTIAAVRPGIYGFRSGPATRQGLVNT